MPQPKEFLNLFNSPLKFCIALFGGGGKTSLLYQLGRELARQYNRVLLTSIVKAGPSPNFPIVLLKPDNPVENLFKDHLPLYLLKKQIGIDKYQGFTPAELESLLLDTDTTVFEADGARDLPLKAHNETDPTIPLFASHVVILVGADVIGSKMSDGKVHRPEIFKSLWHIDDTTTIDVELVAEVVTSDKGYLSKIPEPVSKIYFVNKADAYPEEAQSLGESISLTTSLPVYFGSVKKTWWEQIS